MRIPGRIATENMLEVPDSVDDASAALAEPLACVLRGIHEMELRDRRHRRGNWLRADRA